MGVLDLFTGALKKRPPAEVNYLSLTITSQQIFASVWQLSGSSLKFIGFEEKNFHTIDSLIHEAAAAIDSAAQNIKSDLNQVVFGLSYYWFEDGKISNETTNILKDLSQELDLVATAFVPIAASVNHFLKIKEGNTPKTIFAGIYKDFTEVCLLGGKNILTKFYKGQASEENIASLISSLKSEGGQDLPKRIIICGVQKADHLYKELAKNNLKEVYGNTVPSFELMDSEEIAKCISYSQAADVLGHEPLLTNSHEAHIPPVDPGSDKKEDEKPEVTEPKEEPSGFDFQEGVDVLENAQQEHSKEPQLSPEPTSSHQNHNQTSKEQYAVETGKSEISQADLYQSPAEKAEEREKSRKKNFVDSIITLSWFARVASMLSGGTTIKKVMVAAIVMAICILLVGIIAAYTITSVQLTLKVTSKPISDDFNVTVASDAALDTTRMRIPGQEMNATAQGSQQTATTGTKKTGNSAKGQVQVFNWTTSGVTFDAQTTIISKDGIKFKLESQVEVASRSASTPGQATVSITAQDFGPSGNLSSGSDFTFQKYDELLYSAKNDSALTGGDEKQISTVAQEDIAKLEKSLTDELSSTAKASLKEKTVDKQVNDDAIVVKVTRKQFDKKFEDEGTNLSLDMEVESSALVYDQNTLKDLLSQKAQESSQDQLESKPENVDLLDVSVKAAKDSLKISGKYQANLIPKINEDGLKDKIAGKSLKDAREIIKSNPDIGDVDAKFSPNLIFFSTIPTNKSKISLKVEAIK